MKRVPQAWAAAMAVAAGLTAVLAGGCTQSTGPSDGAVPTPPVAPAALASGAMAVRWQSEAPLAPNTHLTDLWVRGGYVIGHGSDHRVYVLDAETGVRQWSADLAEPHETMWAPAAHRGHLWFVTTTRLMGFRVSDGRNIVAEALTPASEFAPAPEEGEAKEDSQVVERGPTWGGTTDAQRRAAADIAQIERREDELNRFLAAKKNAIHLGFGPAGPPATDGSHVFIPDAKGWLQAVSIRPRLISWGRWTDDAVTAGPVVDANHVYFAGHNGMVYASAQDARRTIWQYQTEGPIRADLRLTDTGMVLVGSTDYSLYAFDGASGVLEWNQLPNRRYNAGEPIRKPPYTFGEQIFLFTLNAGLTVLDTTTGKKQWQLPTGLDLITADADTVYVLGRGNDLLAVDRTKGEVRFAIPLRRGTRIGINESGTGVLYLATPEGQVWAIASAAEPEPPAEAPPPGEEAPAPAPSP